MEPILIGINQLHKELTKVTRATQRGRSFLVMKHAKPMFRIEPATAPQAKKYRLSDLLALQFHGDDKNLSKNIDKIVYGV